MLLTIISALVADLCFEVIYFQRGSARPAPPGALLFERKLKRTSLQRSGGGCSLHRPRSRGLPGPGRSAAVRSDKFEAPNLKVRSADLPTLTSHCIPSRSLRPSSGAPPRQGNPLTQKNSYTIKQDKFKNVSSSRLGSQASPEQQPLCAYLPLSHPRGSPFLRGESAGCLAHPASSAPAIPRWPYWRRGKCS